MKVINLKIEATQNGKQLKVEKDKYSLEKRYAQRLSKVSECRSPRMREGKVESEKSGESIMLKDTPKCRSEEARECGSVPRLRVPRMRERKARKVVNAGNAELGARMSGMIAKLKNIVLNDTPKCRSEEARECGSVPRLRVPRMRERKARKVVNAGNTERGARMFGMIAKLKNIVLNDTPKCRSRTVVRRLCRRHGHGRLSGSCRYFDFIVPQLENINFLNIVIFDVFNVLMQGDQDAHGRCADFSRRWRRNVGGGDGNRAIFYKESPGHGES